MHLWSSKNVAEVPEVWKNEIGMARLFTLTQESGTSRGDMILKITHYLHFVNLFNALSQVWACSDE